MHQCNFFFDLTGSFFASGDAYTQPRLTGGEKPQSHQDTKNKYLMSKLRAFVSWWRNYFV